MEELTVKDDVRENNRNDSALVIFIPEIIVPPHQTPGEISRLYLPEQRREGRYPLLGDGAAYRPIKEEAIIVAPKKWGATTPRDLVGACVGITVIGTIPIIKDNRLTAEILIVRLTEPDGTAPADFIRADWTSVVETDVYLGMDTWVDYPPGIHFQPAPAPFPTPEEAEKAEEEDPDNYW